MARNWSSSSTALNRGLTPSQETGSLHAPYPVTAALTMSRAPWDPMTARSRPPATRPCSPTPSFRHFRVSLSAANADGVASH